LVEIGRTFDADCGTLLLRRTRASMLSAIVGGPHVRRAADADPN
jgi:hypothetical protein